MDITKSTLRGALALVVLTIVLFSWHGHLLNERKECGLRLQHAATRLSSYAAMHQGNLPADEVTLRKVTGPLPFTLAIEPCKWQQQQNKPYLWDADQHPFVNGIHVLATDGKVYLVNSLSDLPVR